jgi:hypothetical protein
MTTKFVKTIEQLPSYVDLQCPICLENVVPDEQKYGVPNCVMCENGHRIHNNPCYMSLTSTPRICPICRTSNFGFCYSKLLGYAYIERKGGKKRKTQKKRKTKTNKRLKSKKV